MSTNRIAILESEASIFAGGAEKSMAQFSDYLINNNHLVYHIFERGGKYTAKGLLPKNSIRVNLQTLRGQGPFSYFYTVFKISSFVKKNNINILLTHTIHTLALLRFVKILTNCHIVIYFKWIYNGPSIGSLAKWGLNGISQILAINNFVASYWKKFLPSDIVVPLIPDGVAHAEIPHDIASSNFNILFIGRIYEGKGLHLILEALKELPSNFTLDVVGSFVSGEYKNRIDIILSLYNLKERVRFHGLVFNVETYYKNCFLVVVPSIVDDAQPLVILESMARQKLVIASNVGGIATILTGTLSTLIFEPTAQQLSAKINQIYNLSLEDKHNLKVCLYDRFIKQYEITNTHRQLEKYLL